MRRRKPSPIPHTCAEYNRASFERSPSRRDAEIQRQADLFWLKLLAAFIAVITLVMKALG